MYTISNARMTLKSTVEGTVERIQFTFCSLIQVRYNFKCIHSTVRATLHMQDTVLEDQGYVRAIAIHQ